MYSFLEITDVSVYLFDIIFGAYIDIFTDFLILFLKLLLFWQFQPSIHSLSKAWVVCGIVTINSISFPTAPAKFLGDY